MSDLTPLLSEAEAAQYLGMSPRYLQERRYRGGGPEYLRLSHRTVKYHPDALARWLAERSYTATCQEPPRQAAGPEPKALEEPPAPGRTASQR